MSSIPLILQSVQQHPHERRVLVGGETSCSLEQDRPGVHTRIRGTLQTCCAQSWAAQANNRMCKVCHCTPAGCLGIDSPQEQLDCLTVSIMHPFTLMRNCQRCMVPCWNSIETPTSLFMEPTDVAIHQLTTWHKCFHTQPHCVCVCRAEDG